MTPSEEELFKAMSIGIMFRLGFQSLLAAAARRKGCHAAAWLDDFEERVIEQARRMKAHEPLPRRLVDETVAAVVGEFEQVFSDVRRQLAADRRKRWPRQLDRQAASPPHRHGGRIQ